MRPKHTALLLLLLIRNGKVSDWAALCQHFGVDPEGRNLPSLTAQLKSSLNKLKALNLVSEASGVFTVTDYWGDLYGALGVSLTELAKFDLSESIVVRPIFGAPRATRDSSDVFVAMPFAPELNAFYQEHVKRLLQAQGLSVVRGDEFSTVNHVIDDIWRAIYGCKFMVADCTGRNPNVFYEIGMAHTLGKPVLLVSQDRGDVPFNINAFRYLTYELSRVGINEFDVRFVSNVNNILRGLPSEVNPSVKGTSRKRAAPYVERWAS